MTVDDLPARVRSAIRRRLTSFFQAHPSLDLTLRLKLAATLKAGACRVGPFEGEFGHVLGHVLPFVRYLYDRNVAVDFCGLDIYKPLFVDEQGRSIVKRYVDLREAFHESPPFSQGQLSAPTDVVATRDSFIMEARHSPIPFWDISDFDYYFNRFRWWLLYQGCVHTTRFSELYKSPPENACVLFARTNKVILRENNGDPWDYRETVDRLAVSFDKVYVAGHPAFTAKLDDHPRVTTCITTDNRKIMETCSKSRLIVTPHSGACYVGPYTDCSVIVIYQRDGCRTIGNFEDTVRTFQALGGRWPLQCAFTLDELELQARQVARDPLVA